jgi:drug/metabolite transporter (DMT)-like permease
MGVAGTVLCCALWGGNAVATKYAISPEGLPAFGCATIRFLISLPIVLLVCLRQGKELRFQFRDGWIYLVHGLITALQIGSYNWGTSQSEAGRSSVFINVHPLVVAPLAWLVLGEHLGTRGVIGLSSAALGVTIILARRLLQGGGLTGDVVVLVSGVIFGIQTVAQKLTFTRVPATTLLLAQSLVAIPITMAISLALEGLGQYHFTREATWGLFYQGVAVSGICFSLWMILLGRYPASRLATIAFLTPLFGLTFSNLTRGDRLTPSLLVGGVLVGLGIYLVASGRNIERAPTASSAVRTIES